MRRLSPRRALMALTLTIASLSVTGSSPAGATTRTPLPGIDISHHQGSIDWNKVAGADYRFVIAKATEGQTFDDPNYGTYRSGARAAGLEFTAYHFARPDAGARDALIEADHFVRVAGLGRGDLIPVLDLEVTGSLPSTALIEWTKEWMKRVEAKLGIKAMIYTSPYFWRTYMADTTFFARHGHHLLWISNWGVSDPDVPALNWAHNGWTYWQWSSCGSVPGISGCVDLDRFRGRDFTDVTLI